MPHLLRLLTSFMVMFTVPLQGMAAVTAGICMALGHHGDTAVAAEHQHPEHAQSEYSRAVADIAEPAVGPKDGGPGGPHSHCAPCVACCASLAVAPAAKFPIPGSPAGSVLPAATAFPSGVTPEKLDRPPLAL